MLRLFVGLELPDEVKQSLVIPRSGVEGAYWQRDDQLHITLAFIGDVSPSTMEEIIGGLASIDFAPFEMCLDGVDLFGTSYQPRNLHARTTNYGAINHLHDKVMRQLAMVDAPERITVDQRKFKPHVTLARFSNQAKARIEAWMQANQSYRSPVFEVSHFTLFSSYLTSDRAYYTAEARFGIDSNV